MRLPAGRRLVGLLTVVLAIGLLVSACSQDRTAPTAPDQELLAKGAPALHTGLDVVAQAMAVQNRHTPSLMATPGVVGTAVGADERGAPVLLLLHEGPVAPLGVPASFEGLKVKPLRAGKLVAMKKPVAGTDHTTAQTPPIQLGTTGGWGLDLANGYCCGGTLGSLIQIGGSQYVLSNWHVLEADIVAGGNGVVATTGDPVIHPGLIDVGCYASQATAVATLAVRNALPANNVDCAIAQVIGGMVRSDGAILEIGTLSSQTVAAFIGQAVKKSGRTTGLTRSSVTGLNGTVSITYENECAGATAFTKTFTGQIILENKRESFLAGGDSGSLMVEDVSVAPRAVGLLFAGSRFTAIANPIDEVLSFLGASMVGD